MQGTSRTFLRSGGEAGSTDCPTLGPVPAQQEKGQGPFKRHFSLWLLPPKTEDTVPVYKAGSISEHDLHCCWTSELGVCLLG